MAYATSVLGKVGLVIAIILGVAGCALMWHNVNGLSTTALDARARTAYIFDYIYLLFFAILAVAGRAHGKDGMQRVGLIGVAAIVYLVHYANVTGEGWHNANAYRLAVRDDTRYFGFTMADHDANKEMFAGMLLCFTASLVALLACAVGPEDRVFPGMGALITFVVSAIIIIGICIASWNHDLTEIQPIPVFAQLVIYVVSWTVIAKVLVLLFILGVGIFFDVPEYVGVVAFQASGEFAHVLQAGFTIIDITEFSPTSDDERNTAKAGTALFYISCFCLMLCSALYFWKRYSDAVERAPGFLNYLLALAAVICLIPGVAMLFHQCRGLARINAGTGDRSDYDIDANVAEAFVYIYIVFLGLCGLMTYRPGHHGMVQFFIIGAAGMLYNLSFLDGQFGWANGNVFRRADMDDVQITYGDERVLKQTMPGDDDAVKQVVSGFVLCQAASFLVLLSLVTLSSGLRRVSFVAVLLGLISIAAFVTCGVFEAESRNAAVVPVGAPVQGGLFITGGTYYETINMVTKFFFMAFFVLLGLVLGVAEYVWISVIVVSSSGLQLLALGFQIAHDVEATSDNQRDRAIAAGAIGFFFSLMVCLAAAFALNLFVNDERAVVRYDPNNPNVTHSEVPRSVTTHVV